MADKSELNSGKKEQFERVKPEIEKSFKKYFRDRGDRLEEIDKILEPVKLENEEILGLKSVAGDDDKRRIFIEVVEEIKENSGDLGRIYSEPTMSNLYEILKFYKETRAQMGRENLGKMLDDIKRTTLTVKEFGGEKRKETYGRLEEGGINVNRFLKDGNLDVQSQSGSQELASRRKQLQSAIEAYRNGEITKDQYEILEKIGFYKNELSWAKIVDTDEQSKILTRKMDSAPAEEVEIVGRGSKSVVEVIAESEEILAKCFLKEKINLQGVDDEIDCLRILETAGFDQARINRWKAQISWENDRAVAAQEMFVEAQNIYLKTIIGSGNYEKIIASFSKITELNKYGHNTHKEAELLSRDIILLGLEVSKKRNWNDEKKEALIGILNHKFSTARKMGIEADHEQNRRDQEQLIDQDTGEIVWQGNGEERREMLRSVEMVKQRAMDDFTELLKFDESNRILVPFLGSVDMAIRRLISEGAERFCSKKELESLYRYMLISRAILYVRQYEGTLWSSGFMGRPNDAKDQSWINILKLTGLPDETMAVLMFGNDNPEAVNSEGSLFDISKIDLALKTFVNLGQKESSYGTVNGLKKGITFNEMESDCKKIFESLRDHGVSMFDVRMAQTMFQYFIEGKYNSKHHSYSFVHPQKHVGSIVNNAPSLWWGGSDWMFKSAVVNNEVALGNNPMEDYPVTDRVIDGRVITVEDKRLNGLPESFGKVLGEMIEVVEDGERVTFEKASEEGRGSNFLRNYFKERFFAAKSIRDMTSWVVHARSMQSYLNEYIEIGGKKPDTLNPSYLIKLRQKLLDNAVGDTPAGEIEIISPEDLEKMLRVSARIMFLETSAFNTGLDDKTRWDPVRSWKEYIALLNDERGACYFDFASELLSTTESVSDKKKIVDPVIREHLVQFKNRTTGQIEIMRRFVRKIGQRYMDNTTLSNELKASNKDHFDACKRLLSSLKNYPNEPDKLDILQSMGKVNWGAGVDGASRNVMKSMHDTNTKRMQKEKNMDDWLSNHLGRVGKWWAGED